MTIHIDSAMMESLRMTFLVWLLVVVAALFVIIIFALRAHLRDISNDDKEIDDGMPARPER